MDANFSQNISVSKDPSGAVSPAFLEQFTKDADGSEGSTQVRFVLSGSDKAVQDAIAQLQALGVASADGWEPSELDSADIDKLEEKILRADTREERNGTHKPD